MAKKKKTQLKPVARGFATTSVPKKIVETAEASESTPTHESTESLGLAGEQEPLSIRPESEFPLHDSDESVLEKEQQSLQTLVERLQDKTEKEITRTVKTVEQERRFSKSLSRLELDPITVDHILRLALESETLEGKVIDEPEDKAIARLAISYGVLRRLGFSESRVEECLRSINGIDLDEAYEWLCLHCPEEELEHEKSLHDVLEPRTPKTPQTFQTPRTPRTPRTPHTPQTPRTPRLSSGLSTPTQSRSESRLNVNAPEFVPSGKSSPIPPIWDVEDERAALKSRILASYRRGSSSDSDNESDEVEDPNLEYVRLKLQITDLQKHEGGQAFDPAFLKSLQARLEDVKKHYFFDQKDAEAQYRIERQKADAASLRSQLRGNTSPAKDTNVAKHRPQELEPQLAPPVLRKIDDIFEGDDEDSAGGMFEILDDMPATEITTEGTTIRIREMALPRHWSGRTPKTLLSEAVFKTDRYAAITYQCISGPSRAKRASVSIHSEGGKTTEWTMEDVACHDMTQAENYIATVALHALSFPPIEGFAAGTTMAAGNQTFFRSLPASFRDLWDELESKRKDSDDSINRSIWAKLKTIIDPKLDTSHKSNGKYGRQTFDAKEVNSARTMGSGTDVNSEQLIAGFRARQASSAYQEMLFHRNQLPVAQYRDEIISVLESSQVLVLSGETGCGKSTQVPTFILEDQLSKGKHCKIYCTEPRRISAISLAQRVSSELGDPPGAVGTISSLIGYSIRLESNTSRNTRLAFVTNGIALRMLEGGTGLGGEGTAFDEITHIVIDEVHERSIESDFLLIVLKSLLQHRRDLKVILMSATVDAEKIANYFGGCPTLHVPGRTFPVDVRYLEDAIEFTGWSIDESSPYARRLHDKFYRGKARNDWSEEAAVRDDEDEEDVQKNVKLERRYSQNTATTINLFDERMIPYDLITRLLERICFEDRSYLDYSSAILVFMPGLGEIRRLNELLLEHPYFGSIDSFQIYPLHSSISSENQGAVFDIPPSGVRKIVIATNIAETGITIPDITCVIDAGKHKEMRFDEKRQLSRLVETFIAKSNAAQRRGRAGRVQEGICFHLFTRLRHDTLMAEHPLPEMLRLSLSDLALRIKIMKVRLGSSIEDVLLRALDPPASVNIQRAVSSLVEVRALTPSEDITPMGRLLSKLPTDVHLGKFLLTATLFHCLDPALTIAAALNSKSPFVTPFGMEQQADSAKRSFQVENSDFLTIHNAFHSWRSTSPGFVHKFCRTNFLSHQNLQQIEELRQQYLGYLIDSSFIHVDGSFIRELSRARYGRHRTRFVTVPLELDYNSKNTAVVNAALAAGLYPKLLTIDTTNNQMRTITNNQPAAFHPSSINFGRSPSEFGVNHLSYFTLMHSKRLYAWETSPVDDVAILLLCGECDFKLASDSAFVDRKIKFRIPPKSNVALKLLRSHLGSLLASQFRGKPLIESHVLWNDLALTVLGKVKIEDDENGERQQSIISVSNHRTM